MTLDASPIHAQACSSRRRRPRPKTSLETMITTTCFLVVALAGNADAYAGAGTAVPKEYYSPDGRNNNLDHPAWGSTSTPRIRAAPPLHSYVDGISQPRTEEHGLPSAHRVLLDLFRVVEPHKNKPTSQMLLYFGQWIAHDITRSQEQRAEPAAGGGSSSSGPARGVETMPIPCGPGRKALAAASANGGKVSMPVAPHPIPIGALGACNAASQHMSSLCPGTASEGGQGSTTLNISEQDGAGDGDGADDTAASAPTDHLLDDVVEPFIRMQRSGVVAPTSTSSTDIGRSSVVPAPQSTTNFATSYIDLDHMYGPIIGGPSEDQYRAYEGGRMILDAHGMPPKDPTTGLYVFADPQTRLGPSLSALAIVFLRYHNLRAEAHASSNPTMADEDLYWLARRDVTAAYQNMVEEKYIPTTLGETLDPYEGYKPDVDPSIDVFFSTSSFRYGHSGLSGVIRMLDADYRPMPQDPLLLRDAFDHTESVLGSSGDDAATAGVLRGLAAEPAKAADASFVDDVAFYTKRMAVANVQRGRDAGLPSYNEAREWFGLGRAESFAELADGKQEVAASLASLYESVDDVDAFVGGLLEPNDNLLGPLVTASMKEQFTRLRDGDRFWYKSLLTEDEIAALPTLSEMIRMTFGEKAMKYYPADSFAAIDQLAVASSGQASASGEDGHLQLLEGGAFNASWDFTQNSNKTRSIRMTLRVDELIDGGYIGIGFGSQSMVGAEIWYCQVIPGSDVSSSCSIPRQEAQSPTTPKPAVFSCCVASAGSHVVPRCVEDEYILDVEDSCTSPMESFVTLQAPLCKLKADGSKCFELPQGEVDFIAAYSPSLIGPHGFSRRTMGRIDLNTGWGASSSSDSANAGLFALHGGLMIVCWFVLVPAAIWIVRYCKGKAWRLVAHIALVGVSGSLVFAVATMALVSVEGTSFGTVGGGSVFSKHKIVGLSVVAFVAFMLVTGEARRTREINKVIKTTAMDRIVLLAHRCGGFTLLLMAWWNCYTGLEKMIAYENDVVEITWLSTHTTTSEMRFFTIFRQYIFFPWIAAICIIFIMTEIRRRRTVGAKHLQRVAAVRRGSLSLWGSIADGKGLQEMSIENFLQLTRQGSPLTIVDGLVLDIGAFSEYHPGGSRILRFAIGADISEHIIGEKDVDGVRHVHSPTALKTLRTLIKARLTVPQNNSQLGLLPGQGGAQGEMAPSQKRRLSQRGVNLLVFRDATIVDSDFITIEKSISAKPVIRVRLALKREQMDALRGTPLPSTTFIFRGKDAFGGTIERPYTPVKCYARDATASDQDIVSSSVDGSTLPTAYTTRSLRRREEVIYEFLINLIPDGLMSTFLFSKKKNSHIMVQGPMANEVVIDKVCNDEDKKREVMLIAAGTGITPMLQIIDHFLDERETSGLEPPTASNVKPHIFLCWIVYCPSLSFEEAAELRERAHKFGANFRYFIVYANDTTDRLLNKSKPSADGGPTTKVSNRRMSLTKTNSAPGETPKTAGRRMSLTRGAISLQKVETFTHGHGDTAAVPGSARRARRKSFKATDLESEVHNEPQTELPSKPSRRASLSANGESKPLSLRQRRASLTSMGNSGGGLVQTSSSSLRTRRASLSKNIGNILSTAKASNAPCPPPSKPGTSDYDSDDSSLFSDSDTDEGESTVITESFDSPAARRQFQALYRAKGRFDKDLIAKLLPMATGRHFDSPTYGESGEEDDEALMRTRISVKYRDTVVAVCGRPQFDDNCVNILQSLGFDEDQIVTFGAGNVPLSQVIPPSYFNPSIAHTAHF